MSAEKTPVGSPATRAVRAGIDSDAAHRAVVPPITLSTTFSFASLEDRGRYNYSRTANPTRDVLADALCDLEGGAGAVVTSSGTSALLPVLELLSPGAVVAATVDAYGGTWRLLDAYEKKGRISVRWCDLSTPAGVAEAVAAKPSMIFAETPSNPLLRVSDLRAVSQAAREVGAQLVVDNTVLSPVWQRPLELGADIVMHSTTKYLNGHSDVIAGALVARDAAVVEELQWWANCLGVTGSAFDAYLTMRGVRTVHVRLAQHAKNAMAVAEALSELTGQVYYPGLPSHPGHDVAAAQQDAFGALVSFECPGGAAGLEAFFGGLQHFTLANSLGGVESLCCHPASMTHAGMSDEAQAAAGISKSLVRLAVGIESTDDLVADVRAGLQRALAVASSD